MLTVTASNDWREHHPGAVIGLLELSGVTNSPASPALDQHKREVEHILRERYAGFSRADFLQLFVLDHYSRYYKRFEKTYHVQLQLESVVLKGKNFPNVSPLVDSNFVAELETLVLTAGHDVSKLQGQIVIDVSTETDQFTQMNGTIKTIRAGDMVMRDATGICCTIVYGQDNRSPISAATTHALYVAYAPEGVGAEAVTTQLKLIEANIRLFAPDIIVEQTNIVLA